MLQLQLHFGQPPISQSPNQSQLIRTNPNQSEPQVKFAAIQTNPDYSGPFQTIPDYEIGKPSAGQATESD